MTKPKQVNWELISTSIDSDLYVFVKELIDKYHSGQNDIDITNVQYVLMWRHNIKPDQDGYIYLADITKSPDKSRELYPHDVIIGINKIAWEILDTNQKQALIDYQLERIAPCVDKDNNPKEDDRSRPIYRLCRPEMINESTITRRHNTTINDIRQVVFDTLYKSDAEEGSYVAEQLQDN